MIVLSRPRLRWRRGATTGVATMAAILACAATARSQAHYSELRIDQLQPASAGSPFTRAEGPHKEFDEGIAWGARFAIEYGLKPLRTERIESDPACADPDETSPCPTAFPVEHALFGHIGGSLAPLYWLNLELDFPFAMYETGDEVDYQNGQKLEAGKPGHGDLRIGAHIRAISTKELDLSFGMRVWPPSGSESAYMTGKDKEFVRWEVVPAVAGDVDLLRYGCTLGLAPLFFAGRDGDRLAASCAVQFKVAPMVSLGIEPHLAVFSYAARQDTAPAPKNGKKTPGLGNADFAFALEPMGSALFHIFDFGIGVAGGPGIGNAPGTPQGRVMLTLFYSDLGERVIIEKPPPDADVDGVADAYDACPEQAGPKEARGCPSKRDLDGDGIIEADACPDKPGAVYANPDANGCPDADNDHFADPVDPCPAEPGPTSEGCPKFARLKGDEFAADPPIRFERGRATLENTAQAALVEIVQTMRANPKLEQISVAIGTKGAPQKVTDDRAKALLELFADQNLDSNRYEVVLSDDLKSGDVRVKVIR